MSTTLDETTLVLPTPKEWERILNSNSTTGPFVVIIYNDDWHTFDEVIFQVQKATGCSIEKAKQVTDEIHYSGRAIAYSGTQERCEDVATILREIKLQVETDRSV